MKKEVVINNSKPVKKGFVRKIFKLVIFFIALKSIGKVIIKLFNKVNQKNGIKKNGDRLDLKLICDGRNIKIENEPFKGADILNAFSGLKLDLSNALIEEDVDINCKNLMSGISITVPENVKVELTPKSILSGAVNYVPMVENLTAPTIHIYVDSFMSGFDVKVKNKEEENTDSVNNESELFN